MMEPFEIQTTDKNGVGYCFTVTPSLRWPTMTPFRYWTFTVRAEGDNDPLSGFRLMICVHPGTPERDSEVRVDGLYNNLNAADPTTYRGKGIGEALLAHLAQTFGRDIYSSTSNPDFKRHASEYQTPAGEAFWNRLVEAGKATYDAEKGLFTYSFTPKIDHEETV